MSPVGGSRRIALFVATLATGAPTAARASGFWLYEQSAPALAKAGATAADDARPDAAWFDPAALALSPSRAGVSLSGAFVAAATRFEPSEGGAATSARPGRGFAPALFAHAAVHDRVQLALAALAPFAYAITWPQGWRGAEQALHTRFVVIATNPSVAIKLHPRVAVAVGASLLRGDVQLGAALPADVGGRGDLSGHAWATAWNAAVFVRALPRLQLAATYRSGATLRFTGDATFSPQDPSAALTFADQRARADLPLPDVAGAAALARVTQDLSLSIEASWVRWSRFDRLVVDFDRGTTPDRIIEREPRDPIAVRLGGELALPRWSAVARAGVAYDGSSSGSRTLSPAAPDGDRVLLGAGAGWTRGRFTVDAAYLLAAFFAADAGGAESPAGTYRTHAHVVALTVTLR